MEEEIQIIFLDIDGVLNSVSEVLWHRKRNRIKLAIGEYIRRVIEKCNQPDDLPKFPLDMEGQLYYLTDHCCFDPMACTNLQFILEKCPDARIVVSSVWRSWGIKWMQKILNRNGIDGSRVIDTTYFGFDNIPFRGRGDQIHDWLMANPIWDDFVIIDDESDMEHLIEHLYQTDSHEGLGFRLAQKIIYRFTGKWG